MLDKNITEMWGYLWFDSGDEIELSGDVPDELLTVDAEQIWSIGEHEIGEYANVFLVYEDRSSQTLTTLLEVRDLIEQYQNQVAPC